MSEPEIQQPVLETLLASTKSAWPAFLAARDALIIQIADRLSEAGLPEPNWIDVLWVLEQMPGHRLRMSELAEAAVISRSNLTRLVDRMEKAGLVERQRVSGDRRGTYARLTRDGKLMRKRMWAVYKPAVDEIFANHLSAEENELLRNLMLRILFPKQDDS